VEISDSNSRFSYNRGYSNVPMPRDSFYTVRELIDVIIVRSACAATVALGEAVFGSEEAMVWLMNEKAEQLGVQAEFHDSWGGSPDNRISALGMAEMTRVLIMEYPEVIGITSKRSVGFDDVPYANTNPLLGSNDGIDGFKTGFTNPAGFCFTGTALRDGRRIIAVTLGSTRSERFDDARILIDYGFNNANQVIADYFRNAVRPSNTDVVVNSVLVPISAYKAGGTHSFKLRDLAMLLNETP
jgi:D-alanyl-D-alanine carboxypeptidase (penicillin-binding protein 5/6)